MIPLDRFGSLNLEHPLLNDIGNINTSSLKNNELVALNKLRSMTIFMCIPSPGFEYFFSTYIPIFDILLVAVIPFFLLCFTNIGIIIYTMRNNRRMRQHRKRSHRRHQRLTIMLLSVALAFIGLTCPSVIFICVNKIIYSVNINTGEALDSLVGVTQPSHVQLIVDICEALWYTKHAMNFILYTLSGQDFRREFIKLFTQCFRYRPSILKNLTNQTQTTTLQTIDALPIEMPMITNANRKKLKKQINNNCDISSAISINSQAPPLTL